jgi:hypothetical protein
LKSGAKMSRRKTTIFITGATGNLGREMLLQLIESYSDATLLTLKSKATLYQCGIIPVGAILGEIYDKKTALKYAREYAVEIQLARDAFYGADMLMALSQGYARLGELDSALALIDTPLSTPSELTIPRLKSDPDYRILHNQRGFKTIINKYRKN